MRTAAILAGACVSHVAAQSTISVDLLYPSDDGFAGIPAYRRCVDVFVDIDPADVWTVGGVRVSTHLGATLEYYVDPNAPGWPPFLFNRGLAGKFGTSLSRPRRRDADARFTNAGAWSAGAFNPAGPILVEDDTELNVAYFASPPMTAGSPSVDGYIARISVDVRSVVDDDEYAGWFAGDLSRAPPGALIVVTSEPLTAVAGTVFATFDDPTIRGIDWGLWYVPEPAGIWGAVFLCVAARRVTRR